MQPESPIMVPLFHRPGGWSFHHSAFALCGGTMGGQTREVFNAKKPPPNPSIFMFSVVPMFTGGCFTLQLMLNWWNPDVAPIRPALIFFGTACFASSPLQTRPAKRLQFVNYSRFARFAHVGDVSSLEMLAVLLAAFCWVGVPGVSWHPPKIRYAQHTLQPWPKDRPGKEQPWHQLTQPDRTTIEIQLTACERCAQSCSEATRSVCMCNKLWTSMTENGPCWSHHLLKTAHVSLSLSLSLSLNIHYTHMYLNMYINMYDITHKHTRTHTHIYNMYGCACRVVCQSAWVHRQNRPWASRHRGHRATMGLFSFEIQPEASGSIMSQPGSLHHKNRGWSSYSFHGEYD